MVFIEEFFWAVQNLQFFGKKYQQFSNNMFQSYYDLFQVN